jgi:hypothetical protein
VKKEYMPSIYTEEWVAAMFEVVNSRNNNPAPLPTGEWCLAFEVVGDEVSPYVTRGETRHYLIRLREGRVVECRENQERIAGKELHFRFTGSAHIYEGVAAGIVNPIVAGLKGSIMVRGDMRLLIKNAEFAAVLFKNIAGSKSTEWPKGKPPYN